jgi:hypothetical protein
LIKAAWRWWSACCSACSAVAGFIFTWFFCRIEPPSGYCAVLIKKDGKDIPADDIIATSSDQKGIQLEPLSEGRYFYDPVFWDWKIVPAHPNPRRRSRREWSGNSARNRPRALRRERKGSRRQMHRGIIAEPLRPGTYRINPFAYASRNGPP